MIEKVQFNCMTFATFFIFRIFCVYKLFKHEIVLLCFAVISVNGEPKDI